MAVGAAAAFDEGVVAEVVERSAWAKVEVVTADEREQVGGGRIRLNLGHTVGARAGGGRRLRDAAPWRGGRVRAAGLDAHRGGARRDAAGARRADRGAPDVAGPRRSRRSPTRRGGPRGDRDRQEARGGAASMGSADGRRVGDPRRVSASSSSADAIESVLAGVAPVRGVSDDVVTTSTDGKPSPPTPTAAERLDAAVELARIRDRIDELDTEIVALLNERATLGREPAAPSTSRAGARSATRSASARSSSAWRWATRARCRRPTSCRSTAGSSPRPGASSTATGPVTAAADEDGGAGPAAADPARRRRGAARTCGAARVPGHPLRAGADRAPPSRAPRQRALHLGPRPGGRRHASCSGSRTTTGSGRGPSTRRRCWTTSSASGSCPMCRRSPRSARARRPTASRTRPRVYEAALEGLRAQGLVYACDCARSTFAAYEAERGRPWRGIGCPGRVPDPGAPRGRGHGPAGGRGRGLGALGGPAGGPARRRAGRDGDLLVRDRVGNWTYAFCVVVDDARHGVDLVIRGRDLLDATPVQLRLARLLGREVPPRYLHHPLVRREPGQKLSKADGDTAVGSLLDAGRTPAELFGLAARLAGLQADEAPIDPQELAAPFGAVS